MDKREHERLSIDTARLVNQMLAWQKAMDKEMVAVTTKPLWWFVMNRGLMFVGRITGLEPVKIGRISDEPPELIDEDGTVLDWASKVEDVS